MCDGHTRCAYTPSAPPGFDLAASTWLVAFMSLNCMYVNVHHGLKAILYNKQNTDMHLTDDYMVA